MQRSAVAMLAQQGGGGGGFKVNYSPDWSLFTEGGDLAQLGLNLLAAIGLVCCTGFFVWGAILAAGRRCPATRAAPRVVNAHACRA
jgi:hypothetical protein